MSGCTGALFQDGGWIARMLAGRSNPFRCRLLCFDPISLPVLLHIFDDSLMWLCTTERGQLLARSSKHSVSNVQYIAFIWLWKFNPNRTTEVMDASFLLEPSSQILIHRIEMNQASAFKMR